MSAPVPPSDGGRHRHLLEIDDLSPAELVAVLDLAEVQNPPAVLAGLGIALLFEKPSARTRHSMEMAIFQLGGHPSYIQAAEVGLDTRESVEDVTRTLGGYYAAIGARVYDHVTVTRMAAVDRVPVLNLLCDRSHPMQALADLLTIRQQLGSLAGRVLAFIGDANNVCRSLCLAAAAAGMKVRIASPPGYTLDETDVDRIRSAGAEPVLTNDPAEAAEGADVIYTDVWISMGQEGETQERRNAFARYRVTAALMDAASPNAIFLHCLPAHRGDEVEGQVVDGPRSRIWEQAENRMHAARGLLLWMFGPR